MRSASALVSALAVAVAFAPSGHAATVDAPKAPVNTVCPVDGKKVDAAISAISGRTKEGKTVMIATCSEDCAAKVRQKPDQYADDAVANKQHEEHQEKAKQP